MGRDFKQFGTVEDKNQKSKARPTHSGRKESVRSPENIAAARESVKREPRKSLRRRSLELKLSKSSLLRILKIDNGLKNYTIQIHKRLSKAM